MSNSPQSPDAGTPPTGGGDPWAAFSYLVAGVALYGLIGWGLGKWLHASYLTAVGIVVGAVLGLVLVYFRMGRVPSTETASPGASDPDEPGPEPTAPEHRGDNE